MDQLEELESLLPRIGPAIERSRLGHSLVDAAEKLKDFPRHLRRLIAVIDIARETEFGITGSQATPLREVLREADLLADELQTVADSDALRVVSASYSDFVKSLNNFERQLREHWTRTADREFTPLVTIGELLERLGVAVDLARRMITCGRDAQSFGSKDAPDLREAILAVRRRRSELNRERSALTGNIEVDTFLDALANQRATLIDVTDGVRAWLASNDALSRFGVRPTG